MSQRFWVVKSEWGESVVSLSLKRSSSIRKFMHHVWRSESDGNSVLWRRLKREGWRCVQVELREVARDLNTSAKRPRTEETEKERACESA